MIESIVRSEDEGGIIISRHCEDIAFAYSGCDNVK